jgi:V/A-type H+-transporting ATPase subunit I
VAIEKMKILNLVGQLSDYNDIMHGIILSNDIQLINAYKQINESKFTLEMIKDNIDEIVDMSQIGIYENDMDISDLNIKLSKIVENLDEEFKIDYEVLESSYNFKEIVNKINMIYELFKKDNNKIMEINTEIDRLEGMLCIESLIGIDFDFKKVYEMDKFDIKFGRMTTKNRNRLTMNYENVTAAVMHLESSYSNDLYLVSFPKSLKNETERILKSVYFEEIKIDVNFLGKPKEMSINVESKIASLKIEGENTYKRINEMKKIYFRDVYECYSILKMQKKIIEVGNLIASTEHFFYLSAWIPEEKIESVEKIIEADGRNVIMELADYSSSGLNPPTKLKNNWFSKPFESLVNMYGIPNYKEVDPTAFFSIAYMILFGAMFGDLGQGFVFLLAGIFLMKKKGQETNGALACRIGISSMIFGFFYDSLFGYEKIISKIIPLNIFIRPIENINIMLSSAIALGIILLYISFGYSIYNKLKIGDIKEGLFGRNGVTGLVLYSSMLIIVLVKVIDSLKINVSIFIGISIFAVILLIIREPISNKIMKKDYLYNESAGDYYVESGFDLLETFLSMLSNTVSFIRVGAFALNHVGLFIAFHTMAELIGSSFGNVSMFIIGNIVIILLEGLIVFIQGLRLMYYEIFSKYYIGDGYKFKPSGLE